MTDTMTAAELQAELAEAMLEKGRGGLQDQMMSRLKAHGWKRAYHTWNSQKSSPGYPDIIALRNGFRLAIELKREGAWPTSDQEDWLNDYADVDEVNGGNTETYLLFPTDLIDGTVDEILTGNTVWYALWTTRRDARNEETT